MLDLPPAKQPPEWHKSLQGLAEGCKATGDELLGVLKGLATSGKRWKSFRVALASMWEQSKIDATIMRLESYKSQMTLCLVLQIEAINRQLDTTLSGKISELVNNFGTIIKSLADEFRDQLKKEGTTYDQKIDAVLPEDGIWKSEAQLSKADPINIGKASEILIRVASEGNDVATTLAILKALRYNSMDFRHSRIADAHPHTFQWIFSHRLDRWLQSNHMPIYWVSGKPGSGKSTLIKYVVDNPETISYLRLWAGGRRLVTASFFFWIAGTEIQKSQDGLFRSLLFEILRQCPEMTPVAFPSVWSNIAHHLDLDAWHHHDLVEALRRIKLHDSWSTCFCFFIDGLDEYNGSHIELIKVLQDLVTGLNVKICLSSRPWNIFEHAFGKDIVSKVYVQDLNKEDIKAYVEQKLEEQPDFQELASREEGAAELVSDLIGKAQGVFLWVYLVVRSLLDGLVNDDRISDLHRRLRAFPPDLDEYFRYIFDSLDPIYQLQTGRALVVFLTSRQPLTLMNHWSLDLEEEDANFALKMDQRCLPETEVDLQSSRMSKRLNARCKGLLEVTPFPSLVSDYNYQNQVDFLHRTVRDFLIEQADIRERLSSWTKESFNPHLAICRILLAEVKMLRVDPAYFEDHSILSERIEEFAFHMQVVESQVGSYPEELLDELERTIAGFSKAIYVQDPHQSLPVKSYPWANWSFADRRWRTIRGDTFLTFAVERNLSRYVQLKLDKGKQYLHRSEGRPLLDYATGNIFDGDWNRQRRDAHLQIVTSLLSHGADPNECWNRGTVWGNYLYFLSNKKAYSAAAEDWPRQFYFDLISQFLTHGAEYLNPVKANPAARYDITMVTKSPFLLSPSETIKNMLPEDITELLRRRLQAGYPRDLARERSKTKQMLKKFFHGKNI
ncbi:hypothetical protein B7463_g6064, partial [Scytalidium lignicola]